MNSTSMISTPSGAAEPMILPTEGKSWLRYELMMVLIFILGISLLKVLVFYFRKFWSTLCRPAAPRLPAQQAKSDNRDIANAALKILRQGTVRDPNSGAVPAPLQQLAQHLRDSPFIEPIEVLNRLQKMGVFPDVSIYNTLLEACINAKHFQTAYQLFMELKEPSSLVTPDVITYNVYMRGIIEAINSGEHVDISMIADLLKEMRGREIQPNAGTFSTIMEVCAISGEMARAWDYFVMMQRDYRLEPDTVTFANIVKGIRATEKGTDYFDLLFPSLLSHIASKADSVDDSLINGVIDICGKLGGLDKAELLLDVLRRSKRKLSLVSYGKLITLYGQYRKPLMVDQLFAELKKAKVETNEVTYGCIMEAYLRCGMFDRVEEVYGELQHDPRVHSNIVIYTTLIRALAKKQDFAHVSALYEGLRRNPTCKLNRIAYNALLDCCVKCAQYERMSGIYEDMLRAAAAEQCKENADSVEPDLITYSTLIKGMCRSGQMRKAIALYEEMRHKGLELDEVVFNSLLDGCVKCDCPFKESERIIADMNNLKIRFSNYTYSILIKLYARNRVADKALAVLDDMKKNGVTPGVIVYTCLLQVCIKNKMTDRAIELFSQMRESKVQPDKTAYNTIVNGCVFSGRLAAACSILSQAMDENVTLHEDVYNSVLRNFLINHKMTPAQKHEQATKVCNYVKLHKIAVNQEYLTQVLNTFVFNQPSAQPQSQPTSYGYYQPQAYYGYSPAVYQGGYQAPTAGYQTNYVRKDRQHKY